MEDKEKKTQEEPEVVELGQKELKELLAGAVKEVIAPIAEKVDRLEKEKSKILPEPEVKAQEKEEKEERPKIKFPATKKNVDNWGLPKDEFCFTRFIEARRSGNWEGAEYEKEVLEFSRKKALVWASGSGGGYWVDTEFLPQEFIDYFAAQVVCRKAGCQVIKAQGSPVEIPKATAGATAYWVAQNATITASDQTPGQLQLTPHWCVARTQLSRFLVQSSGGVAEQIVRRDIASQLARAVDDAMLEGPGTSGKPTGMASTSSINTVAIGTNGGAITFDLLRQMLYELQADDVPMDGVVWVMHPRTWDAICGITINSEAAHYVINPSQQLSESMKLYGFPVYLSTQVSITNSKGSGTNLANIFLVNMKDIILCEWGGLELESTDIGGDAWVKNLIEVKATYTVDVGVRHADSVCLISDSTS